MNNDYVYIGLSGHTLVMPKPYQRNKIYAAAKAKIKEHGAVDVSYMGIGTADGDKLQSLRIKNNGRIAFVGVSGKVLRLPWLEQGMLLENFINKEEVTPFVGVG